MLTQEAKLYTNIPVAEKYAILEAMRLELDRLYHDDRPTYERSGLRPVGADCGANAVSMTPDFI